MQFLIELLGTVAFAISGAMTGIKSKMDILGVAVLGLTTAVGGGILRDLLVGVTPPTAFQDPVYALTAVVVSLIVFLPFVRPHIDADGMLLNLIDAIGLGMFTVIGTRIGSEHGSLFQQVFLGALTGVGGGVLRDIFAMQKPMIFVRHFYALASILGATVCALLLPRSEDAAMISATALVVLLRILAAKYKWHLPKA